MITDTGVSYLLLYRIYDGKRTEGLEPEDETICLQPNSRAKHSGQFYYFVDPEFSGVPIYLFFNC